MLLALLIFELILSGMIIFTTHMIEHKWQLIRTSMKLFGSRRNYKTRADVAFVENILSKCEDGEKEIHKLVHKMLYQEMIGKFSYISVMNLATRLMPLMWLVMVLETAVIWINQVNIREIPTLIIIGGSFTVTVITFLYSLVKGLSSRQEALIEEIVDYTREAYPKYKIRKEQIGKRQIKSEKSERMSSSLETEASVSEETKTDSQQETKPIEQKKQQSGLSAQDIAQILQKL